MLPSPFQLYLSCTSASAAAAAPGITDSSAGTTSCFSSDHLQKYVLPLLTTLSLMLKMPASALTYLNEMDKTSSSSAGGGGAGAASPSPSVMALQRAQALVMSKAHKAFKKDVKAGDMMVPQEAITFEFLRANLEYLKVRVWY